MGNRFKKLFSLIRSKFRRMKWFFAYAGDSNKAYHKLIKVAVITAKQYTMLKPYCIYDGSPSDLTNWLARKGVQIIYHRSGFSEDIATIFGDELPAKGGRGAMLRVEIPKILKHKGIKDEYILYTDCDVMFMKNVDELSVIKPEYFACAPEFEPSSWDYLNTGVMLMNIKNLYRTYDDFISFIRKNMTKDWTWDQTAYNLYYAGKITKLPIEYNWKPYWGESPNKKIVHFHGPKPIQREFLEKGVELEVLQSLYNLHTETYSNMFQKWDQVLSSDT